MSIFPFSTPMTEKSRNPVLEELTAIQQGNEVCRTRFIEQYTNYIISMASRVKGRRIEVENDEEYAVALGAFNRAIDQYDPEKGASFFSFAGLLIKRDVLDLYKRRKSAVEIPVSQLYDGEDGIQREQYQAEDAMRRQEDQFNLQQEIAVYRTLLKEYDLDFGLLVKASPKHTKVRQRMIRLAGMLSEDPAMRAVVVRKKTLPLKEMTAWTDLSRKTLERHRKYILANFILINSDLDYLKGYLKDVMQGGDDV